jgi:hypothetical protein
MEMARKRDGDENDVEKHWLVFKQDELIIIPFGWLNG